MDLEFKIRDFEKQNFIVVSEKKPRESIDESRLGVMNWIKKYKLEKISGEYAFSFKIPKDPSEEMILEVIIPTKDSKKEDRVKIVRERDQKIVSGIYKGSYDDLRSVHVIIRDYIHANNLEVGRFPVEFYLNNVLSVKQKDLLTEIQLSVIDYKFNMNVKLENIGIKKIKPHKVAVIRHNGPIQEKTLVENKLKKWIDDNKVDHGEFYFEFVTHPDAVHPSENVFQVGVFLNLNENLKETNDIKIYDIPTHNEIVALYKGPYSELPSAHRIVRRYASENNWDVIDLPIEIYLNDPFEVDAEDLLTRIQLPVDYFEFDKTLQLESLIEKYITSPEYVIMKHQGPIQEVSTIRNKVDEWNQKQNIKVSNSYFVRFFTHPLTIFPSKSFFELGFLINRDNVNGHVRVVEFPQHQILSTLYKGPYEDLKEVHEILHDYGIKKGLNLSDYHREKYFNGLSETTEENPLTEVQIPINIK